MDNREYLLGQIKICKRKLNIAKCIDCGIAAAAAGGCVGVLLELTSLFRHFYYVHAAAGLCFAAGLSAGIVYALCRRADMRQAARRLDSYGLKERVLTAYEHMEAARRTEADFAGAEASDDDFVQLQREDAVLHYNQIRDRIKISLMPDKKHVLALILSAAAVLGMSFIPSRVRDEAQLTHQIQAQAEEEREELKELIEALDAVDTESLTEEQRVRLQELSEALKLSEQELTQADSWESLASATSRLDYKYHQAGVSLEQIASQLGNPETAGIADAMALAKAAANQDGQQLASAGTAGSSTSGQAQGENGGQGDGSGEGSGDGQGDGSGGGSGGGQGDGSGDGQGDGSDGGQGDGSGGGQGDGSGDGQGDGSGSGQGDGSGDGQGSGSGDGQGSGSGGGQGSGSGSGRGTGSTGNIHDYVSIPNAIANDSSLTGSKYGDENSDYYRQQNGLAWEGEHVEYSSVIGEYTENAYEGIANGRYPSGMESVIRDYFENLNTE